MRHELVTCPHSAHLEEITFDTRPIDGKILGVVSCSAFSPPETVDCDQRCRHLLNERMDRRMAERPSVLLSALRRRRR